MTSRLPTLDAESIGALIDQLVRSSANTNNADLIKEIILSTLKMGRDGSDRGDLKILNSSFKELRYAFNVFAPYRKIRKVSVFGSARTPSDSPDYLHAQEFASRMTKEGFMVITGAGPGIMEAANKGAGKEMSFGVNILLPFEQNANRFIREDPKLIHLRYFFTRKLLFVKEADAAVFFPGGVGTQDEGFEILTLVQTGKRDPLPIIFVDSPQGSYWKDWEIYLHRNLVETGKVSQEDLCLFKVTDQVEVAVEEIRRFYHRYHSLRFVRDRLILRLHQPLPTGRLEEINLGFSSILRKGKIEETDPLSDESNEPHIAHLGRLALYFDRRHYGRLRQLIDQINVP